MEKAIIYTCLIYGMLYHRVIENGIFPMQLLFLCVCVCVCARACVHARALSCQVVSEFLQPHELKLARLFCPWDFPSKNTGVGYHILLEGVLPTQGLSLFHYVL